ncbi:MAG: hypothetical protein JWQ92_1028, partial [Amnibacterium sp.]|nr:hypothetical protein [Amnibacterium sp.]
MPRVVIVPGLAARGGAVRAARAARLRARDVQLLRA